MFPPNDTEPLKCESPDPSNLPNDAVDAALALKIFVDWLIVIKLAEVSTPIPLLSCKSAPVKLLCVFAIVLSL